MSTSSVHQGKPISGVGIGLRSKYVEEVLSSFPQVGWFEVLTDNYFMKGGSDLLQLDAICEHYPITMHSVGMSLGSVSPLNIEYLGKIKGLKDRFAPSWISEHLCWTSVHGHEFHDLLPLPYTEETIKHVVSRISKVQDFLGEQILIENVSSYLTYKESEMDEWEFLREVVTRADCFVLLDINNIYVSSVNHGFSPQDYLETVPKERVRELHLGGHEEREGYLLDSHSCAVSNEVWELYQSVIDKFGNIPTLLEWDNDLPEFEVMLSQAAVAESMMVGREQA